MLRYDVAIIGGGFAGMMILHHLVALAAPDMRIVIFEPREKLGEGPAYGTRNPRHLLNVAAAQISAYDDKPEHFHEWLNGEAGASATAQLGITPKTWAATDFAPRALFAAYIAQIHGVTHAEAKAKNLIIDHIPALALSVKPTTSGELQISTQYRQVQAKKAVLALGNLPVKPSTQPNVIQNVWQFDYTKLKDSDKPVTIIGAGLTMVDVFLSLRDAGYKGPVHAISRHGLLPRAHGPVQGNYESAVKQLAAAPQSLLKLMQAFRSEIATCVNSNLSWQLVFSKWRPYLPTLWMGLTTKDRVSFMRRLFTYWNIHRHRMAPESAAVIDRERAEGTLHIDAATLGDSATVDAAYIFDCRGPSYDIARSEHPLLKRMLQDGLIQRHATGWGLAVDQNFRAAGRSDTLYVIGTLAIGERLESTAVPELRGQAKDIATKILGAL